MRGTVKWFSDARGYGFIAGETGDFFVHQKNVCMDGYRKLESGQHVEFDIEETEKGPTAINVHPGPVPERPRSFREQVITKESVV